jgi:hypothetical protein
MRINDRIPQRIRLSHVNNMRIARLTSAQPDRSGIDRAIGRGKGIAHFDLVLSPHRRASRAAAPPSAVR